MVWVLMSFFFFSPQAKRSLLLGTLPILFQKQTSTQYQVSDGEGFLVLPVAHGPLALAQ